MIIKSITLENIRSYSEPTKIEFDEGILLFRGDIGSGKTSVLMGIEFALFGESEKEFYKKLLRRGAKKGGVKVEVVSNGNNYVVYRSLSYDGKKYNADECYVEINGVRRPMTPTELRRFVTSQIVGIREDRRRRRMPFYRYAIYTRQEEMKTILEEKEKDRMEVIRKIFKLDEYKNILDNISIAVQKLREEEKEREGFINALKGKDEELKEKREEREEIFNSIGETNKKLSEVVEELEGLQKNFREMEDLKEKITEVEKNRREVEVRLDEIRKNIEKLRNRIKEKDFVKERMKELEKITEKYDEIKKRLEHLRKLEREKNSKEKKIKEIEGEIKEKKAYLNMIEKEEGELKKIEEERKKLQNVKNKLEKIRKELEEVEGKKSEIEQSIGYWKKEISKLNKELEEFKSLRGQAVCPKCKRKLTEEHVKYLIKSTEDEIRDKKEKFEIESKRKEAIKKRIKYLKDEERKLQKSMGSLEILERRIKEIYKKIEEKDKIEEEIQKLEGEKEKLNKDVERIENEISDLDSVAEEYEKAEKALREYEGLKEKLLNIEKSEKEFQESIKNEETLLKNMEEINEKLEELKKKFSEEVFEKLKERIDLLNKEEAKLRRDIENFQDRIKRIDKEIEKIENDLKKGEKCMEEIGRIVILRDWLKENLTKAVERIEEIRLQQIYEDFRSTFEKFVKDLLTESDIEATIDDKFQPVVYVNSYDMPISSLSGGERTSIALAYRLALNTVVKKYLNLSNITLILDEPTDGFSRDQLMKLKDILDDTEANQIIIVSHERELANIADVVYEVRKERGRSIVRKVM